jgi:HEAT repeat protein
MKRNRSLDVRGFCRTLVWTGLAVGVLAAFCGRPLAQEEKEPSVAEILTTMKKAILEKNDPMRNRMFFKLRKIGKPAVEPLVEVLSDPEPGVSEYAAFTLGWIADPGAIEPLVKYLKGGDKSKKKAALQALGNMAWGTEEKVRKAVHAQAVPTMIEELEKGEIEVQREAAYGLGLAGDRKAIPSLRKYVESSDTLLAFLASEAIERIERFSES